MHLRSVLKGSALYEAMLAAFRGGAVVAASGAAATVLCDPMVDPRGGAYTVGLGFVEGLAVFPYHGTAADHLLARSIDLKPPEAILVGIDAETALVREPGPTWSVAGAGVVTIYGADGPTPYAAGAEGIDLPVAGQVVGVVAPPSVVVVVGGRRGRGRRSLARRLDRDPLDRDLGRRLAVVRAALDRETPRSSGRRRARR